MRQALQRVPTSKLTFICDGPIPSTLLDIAADAEIVAISSSGNSESLLAAVAVAMSYADDDVLYFVEDDYLHEVSALVKLKEVFNHIKPDYVTLYDHPDRYLPRNHPHRDLPLHHYETYWAGTHHWRTVESTCMTFATTLKTLRADLGLFLTHVLPGQLPFDRLLFRRLQGLGQFAASPHRRVLLGAIPSLATHCEALYLAPGVDWQTVISSVEQDAGIVAR
jgi:hypothetical protein